MSIGIEDRREFLQPMVAAWMAKIQRAKDHRKPFDDIARQCMGFYSGGADFMWKADFFKNYVGSSMHPTFKIGIQKAFELVALFGPTLYWRNPAREMPLRKQLELGPDAMGALQDPAMLQMLQMLAQQQQQESASDHLVSSLFEMILNYTPDEQPGGGLATHSSNSITEALVKGRGCLWPAIYTMPSSQRRMVGSFHDSVDNLLIDPDAPGPGLYGATWIAQKCCHPVSLVEREFNLPPGSLAGKGTYESAWSQGERSTDANAGLDRKAGVTSDLMEYYKVYSKVGVGGRLSGPTYMGAGLAEAFDRVCGDYAYVVVAPGVPYPLNAPRERVASSNDDDVRRMFRWPICYWLADRWPCAPLDFYTRPQSPWPIAPMAPGLGELTFLNVMMSQLANKVWMSSRTIMAYMQGLDEEIQAQIKGGADTVFLKMRHDQLDVGKQFQFLQYPQTGVDVLAVIDRVMQMFDKRVGLSELLYAMNSGGQSRTAEDVATKKQMVSIRPDYMAGRVEDWQSDIADMEKFAIRMNLETADVAPVIGQAGAFLWQQQIQNADPERVIRSLKARCVANSTRKPDKTREVENINQMMQYFGPLVQQHFTQTGDPSALNWMAKMWGDSVGQDVTGLMMQPPPPPSPDPRAAEAQQLQQQQLEAAMQAHQQKMQQQGESHQTQMATKQQSAIQELFIRAAQAKQDLELKKEQAKQLPIRGNAA